MNNLSRNEIQGVVNEIMTRLSAVECSVGIHKELETVEVLTFDSPPLVEFVTQCLNCGVVVEQ